MLKSTSLTKNSLDASKCRENLGNLSSSKIEEYTSESGPREREKGKANNCGSKERCMKGGGWMDFLTGEAALLANMETATKESGKKEQSREEGD